MLDFYLIVVYLINYVVASVIYEVHLEPGADPDHVAASLGGVNLGHIGTLPHDIRVQLDSEIANPDDPSDIVDMYHHSQHHKRSFMPRNIVSLEKEVYKKRLRRSPVFFREEEEEPQPKEKIGVLADQLASLLNIRDADFSKQWHLLNRVQVGNDLNVTGLWLQGITGNGSYTAVIDDGLDYLNPELVDNFFAEGSYDFNRKDPLPYPLLNSDRHGTRCATEIAAQRNEFCGVGVAYDGKVAGIRILSGDITNAQEAESLTYANNKNQIYSCSWGPSDDGQTLEGPNHLIQRAFQHGVNEGRDGLGSIFVFASGNGGAHQDDCNCDGYANSIWVATIGAVDRRNLRPFYVEHCSKLIGVTYSSGSGDAIHTGDVSRDRQQSVCTGQHSGTSAAAPIAAGAFALALSQRPDLTWRDIQYIQIFSARQFDNGDMSWQPSAIPGRNFSHWYGFGLIDAYALVDLAKRWELVKPQQWFESAVLKVDTPVNFGTSEVMFNFDFSADDFQAANIERLEHVQVTVNLDASCRGDIEFDLISPNGIVSEILQTRPKDKSTDGFKDWTFSSVKHWTENPVGKWSLRVRNVAQYSSRATLHDWKIKFYGEARDPELVRGKHPLPSMPTPGHKKPLPSQPSKIRPPPPPPPSPLSKQPDLVMVTVNILEIGCVVAFIVILVVLSRGSYFPQVDYEGEDIEIEQLNKALVDDYGDDEEEDDDNISGDDSEIDTSSAIDLNDSDNNLSIGEADMDSREESYDETNTYWREEPYSEANSDSFRGQNYYSNSNSGSFRDQ